MLQYLAIRAADALVKATLDRAARAALPAVFDLVDERLPQAVVEGLPGPTVSGIIAGAISDTLRRPARPAETDALVRLYDPRIAAQKRNRKGGRRRDG